LLIELLPPLIQPVYLNNHAQIMLKNHISHDSAGKYPSIIRELKNSLAFTPMMHCERHFQVTKTYINIVL